jgi:hypothetical protein
VSLSGVSNTDWHACQSPGPSSAACTVSAGAGPLSLSVQPQAAHPNPPSPSSTEVEAPLTPTPMALALAADRLPSLPSQLWVESPAMSYPTYGTIFHPRTFASQVSAAAGGNDLTFSLSAPNMHQLALRLMQKVYLAVDSGDFTNLLSRQMRFVLWVNVLCHSYNLF